MGFERLNFVTISFVFLAFAFMYVYIDIIADVKYLADAYPSMEDDECVKSKYACHYWFMFKLLCRLLLTPILLLVVTWFLLMFVVDMVLPFVTGNNMRTPGSTPEVHTAMFGCVSKDRLLSILPFNAPMPQNGWWFVIQVWLTQLVLLFVVSLVFVRPSLMTKRQRIRSHIRMLMIVLIACLVFLVVIHAINMVGS